jgi:hypothetical protein
MSRIERAYCIADGYAAEALDRTSRCAQVLRAGMYTIQPSADIAARVSAVDSMTARDSTSWIGGAR